MVFASARRGAIVTLTLLSGLQTASGQKTSFDTILSTTCDGTFRFLPDNKLVNVNIDAPFLPRMYGKFIDGIRTYAKEKCKELYDESVFKERFSVGGLLLVGNKWFVDGNSKGRSDACFDNPQTFTRDGLKMYEALFANAMQFDMPMTCTYEHVQEHGSCAFEYSMRGLTDVNLQVRIETCSAYEGFPRLSVGCRGRGCSIFTPCVDSSCSANQVCTDVSDFVGKGTLNSFFIELGMFHSGTTTLSGRAVVESAIAAFGKLFPGGVNTGSSICVPMGVGNFNFEAVYDSYPGWPYSTFRTIFYSYASAWEFDTLLSDMMQNACNTARQISDAFYITNQNILTFGIMSAWDGLVNGTTVFEPKAHWAAFPDVEYPAGEDHLLSVQCDGLIHAFAGTAFPIRIFMPKLPDIMQFWGLQNMAAYPIRDTEDYLKNMAVWRIDPYLYSMQSGASTFGNIEYFLHPAFHFDADGAGMSTLQYSNWKTSKQLSVSIGAIPILGNDFRANVRASVCPNQALGLTRMHISCRGAVCKELLLAKTCSSVCGVGKCQILSGYYSNDYVGQGLWGVNNPLIPLPWAANVVCPSRSPAGPNYEKLTTEQPIRGMLNGVWAGMQYANCDGRMPDKCVSECQMSGPNCVPVNGIPPTWDSNLGFCFPEVNKISVGNIYSVDSENGITFVDISAAAATQYTSAKVVIDPFPESSNHVEQPIKAFAGFQTLVTGTCEGQYQIFPDNELLSVSIDAPIIPRVFKTYMETVDKYVTDRCQAKGKVPPNIGEARFMKRFHPLSFFVSSGMVDDYDACLDDSDTYVRDFVKAYKEYSFLMENLYLPDTCNNVTWIEDGSCKMKIPVMMVPDASFIINIERCDSNHGYVRFAVGCEGGGCNSVLNPCNTDKDCGGNSRCVNPIDEIGPEKVFNFFRDTLHYVSAASPPNAIRQLFDEFISKFGHYFKGSAVPGAGNKKICFPKEYYNSARQQYNAPKYNDDGVVVGIRTTLGVTHTPTCGLELNLTSPDVTILAYSTEIDPNRFNGAVPGKKYPQGYNSHYSFARGESAITKFGKTVSIGGGVCITHDDCTPPGSKVQNLCMSSQDMYGIEFQTHPAPTNDYKCACSVDHNIFFQGLFDPQFIAYGSKCEFNSVLQAYYGSTAEYHYYEMAAPDLAVFRPWDGLLDDGKTQFQKGDQWPKFPQVKIPSGETHVMSIQCDGMITFFEGKPFAIRVYLPKKQELLQFIADKYIASMSTWIPSGLNPSASFNVYQALWRPEVYFARLLRGTSRMLGFPSIAEEISFGDHVMDLGDFTLQKFLDQKASGVGASYSGMKYLLGNDFKANVRFQECSAYPNGLVGMDLTCVGEVCENLKFLPCAPNTACRVGSCTATGFYNSDLIASVLWGTNSPMMEVYGERWPSMTTCPTIQPVGSIGVHETHRSGLLQVGGAFLSLVTTEGCAGRPQCACVSGCFWKENSCVPTSTIDPKWRTEVIDFCFPKLFPFPRAFIQDMGYSTAQIGLPNSANIYSISNGVTMGREVTVYGINATVEVIGAAVMQDVTLPDFACDLNISGGSGSDSSSSSASASGSDSSSSSASASASTSTSGSDSSGSSSDYNHDNSSGLSKVEIILIVAVVLLAVALIAVLFMCFTGKGPMRLRNADFDKLVGLRDVNDSPLD